MGQTTPLISGCCATKRAQTPACARRYEFTSPNGERVSLAAAATKGKVFVYGASAKQVRSWRCVQELEVGGGSQPLASPGLANTVLACCAMYLRSQSALVAPPRAMVVGQFIVPLMLEAPTILLSVVHATTPSHVLHNAGQVEGVRAAADGLRQVVQAEGGSRGHQLQGLSAARSK